MSVNTSLLATGTKQAIRSTAVLMAICGILFPLVITLLAGFIFPFQANGSLLTIDDKTIGSQIVGQEFTEDCYLHGRPSAVHYNTYHEDENGTLVYSDGSEYGGVSSGSNNYANSNPALVERIEADLTDFFEENPTVRQEDVPTELILASGSGLDPHISPASAEVQVDRIVKASGLSEETVREIIAENTHSKALGILGEETVHVLHVNAEIMVAMQDAGLK